MKDNKYLTACAEKVSFGIVKAMKKQAGYEYLIAYKLTVAIYDYTVEFCNRWIPKNSRTYDQMEQGARSGTQNIPEGYMQQSLKIYIRLSGVSRGSLEKLLKDYKALISPISLITPRSL